MCERQCRTKLQALNSLAAARIRSLIDWNITNQSIRNGYTMHYIDIFALCFSLSFYLWAAECKSIESACLNILKRTKHRVRERDEEWWGKKRKKCRLQHQLRLVWIFHSLIGFCRAICLLNQRVLRLTSGYQINEKNERKVAEESWCNNGKKIQPVIPRIVSTLKKAHTFYTYHKRTLLLASQCDGAPMNTLTHT